MAKKKTTRDKQKRIPGTFDERVKAVEKPAEEYADLLSDRMNT